MGAHHGCAMEIGQGADIGQEAGVSVDAAADVGHGKEASYHDPLGAGVKADDAEGEERALEVEVAGVVDAVGVVRGRVVLGVVAQMDLVHPCDDSGQIPFQEAKAEHGASGSDCCSKGEEGERENKT